MVLNKIDLVTKEEVVAIKKKLKGINVHAKIIESEYYDDVFWSEVLGMMLKFD